MIGLFLKKKSLFIATVLLVLISMLSISCVYAHADTFKYIHDPSENLEAMKDIVKDDNAVYGFRPSETGSLKQYASADWSDPELVESGRQDRIAYHNSIASMYDMLKEMQNEGKSVEEIARAVSRRRNELRLEAYADDPVALQTLKERNLEKYGHEEGPLPDELFEQYGSWERVIEKAFSSNAGMDACLGLYDDYYYLYVILGQVKISSPTQEIVENKKTEDEIAKSPVTGDNTNAFPLVLVMILSSIGIGYSTVIINKHEL